MNSPSVSHIVCLYFFPHGLRGGRKLFLTTHTQGCITLTDKTTDELRDDIIRFNESEESLTIKHKNLDKQIQRQAQQVRLAKAKMKAATAQDKRRTTLAKVDVRYNKTSSTFDGRASYEDLSKQLQEEMNVKLNDYRVAGLLLLDKMNLEMTRRDKLSTDIDVRDSALTLKFGHVGELQEEENNLTQLLQKKSQLK